MSFYGTPFFCSELVFESYLSCTRTPLQKTIELNNWTTSKVEQVVKELYDLDASAEHLDGYDDLNFKLDTQRKKRRYLLFKVISETTSDESIECQHAALTHLKEKLGRSYRGPVPISSKAGNEIESIENRRVRVLSFAEGTLLSNLKNPGLYLYKELGSSLGQIDSAFQDFKHVGLNRDLEWDLINLALKKDNLKFIVDPKVKDVVRFFSDQFDGFLEEVHPSLRQSAIHNDANDHNVVLSGHAILPSGIEAIIDYGDLIQQSLVFDPAIAIAYAVMDSDEPLTIAETFIMGFVDNCPLEEKEIEQIYLLVGARLSHSLLMSAEKRISDPDNEYFQISDKKASDAILKWKSLPGSLVSHVLKRAAGVSYLQESDEIVDWLRDNSDKFHPLFPDADDINLLPVLDFSVTSGALNKLQGEPKTESPSLGRYLEPRLVYQGNQFIDQRNRRTIHLGVDIFFKAGTAVFSPLDGIVYGAADNASEFDYGPTLILEHETDAGTKFWTLYGHLDRLSLKRFKLGQKVEKGRLIGNLGSRSVNGNWSPHLHFQLITDILNASANFPGVANSQFLEVWKRISPNPSVLLGLDSKSIAYEIESNEDIMAERTKRLSPSLSLSYADPIKMVKGLGTRLYSETGEEYLDCVNNVCHVGHSHPVVVEALSSQASLLNTNTRYLHDNIIQLSENLTKTLPKGLDVCFFVNSGSEANDLALRLARTFTGNTDVVVIDSGYHGHTSSLIEISPYKFNGKGGSGPGENTTVIPMPDTYRGLYKEDHKEPAMAYANHVDETLKEIKKGRRNLAAFIGETILSCGGQINPPKGFLNLVYKKIRAAGGLCIADEVQTGFGRIGSHFWAFESQGVVPDIVTMGKPMGNGHPIAAVVTTKKIAKAFANGMEYFNTFGGNPVSCAVALSVLETIEAENLQSNAKQVGKYFKKNLKDLQKEIEYIGDVRGEGLFLGIEFVTDRASRTPDPVFAKRVVEEMKGRKILLSTDGPENNVIKIKPPITFTKSDVDLVMQNLRYVLNLESDIYNADLADSESTVLTEDEDSLELDSVLSKSADADDSGSEEKKSEAPKKGPLAQDSWYGEFKADVVGYDTSVKRYGKRSKSSKDKKLFDKLKRALKKDQK